MQIESRNCDQSELKKVLIWVDEVNFGMNHKNSIGPSLKRFLYDEFVCPRGLRLVPDKQGYTNKSRLTIQVNLYIFDIEE